MPSFIGNNIAFNGRGVVGADLILPDEYDYLGNGSSLFAKILRFSVGTHARTSDAYMLAKNPSSGLYEMTGPFTSNVLATRNIGGKTGGVFEGQFATDNTYSEVFRAAISDWSNVSVNVTDNAVNSPIGNLTADKIYENTDINYHYVRQIITFDGSSRYFILIFAQANGRTSFTLQTIGDFAGSCIWDTTLKTATPVGLIDIGGILELADSWFCCYCSGVSTTGASTQLRFYLLNESGSNNYEGDGASGLYFWGANVIKADHWTNYIKAVASVATKPADYFYWDSSVIPNWFKDKFTVKMRLNYDYPSQISVDKPIWSFQKSTSTLSTGTSRKDCAVNASYVYWADYSGNNIKRAGIDGTGETDLLSAANPQGVAIDATNIYWTETGGKVRKAPIGGGSITDLDTTGTSKFGVCVDATTVYFINVDDGKIQKVLIAGGAVSDVVTGLSTPKGITMDSTYLYYVDDDGSTLYRVPIAGGTPELITSVPSTMRFLDNDADYIYVAAYGNDAIYAINKYTYTVTELIEQENVFSVAVLSGTFFYSDNDTNSLKRLDTVTAWLATDGKVKVIDGPDTKIETDALSCDMHDEVEIEFDRASGEITTSGFTGDDTFSDSSWTSPDGYDVQYGGALKGAASSDGILFEPRG